jgi:DNA-binding NarL/FixJ family response regulator
MLRERRAASGIWRVLTPKETMVLDCLMRGAANKEIALVLGCSVKTVEFHVTNLLRKHCVTSRLELVIERSRHRVL